MTAVCCTLLWNHFQKKKKKKKNPVWEGRQRLSNRLSGCLMSVRSGSAQRPPHSSDILEQMGVIDLTVVIKIKVSK